MKKLYKVFITIGLSALILSGCKSLNPSVMLKTGKDYQYTPFPTIPSNEYRISVNDELSFSIFSNDGFKMVDALAGVTGNTMLSGRNRGMTTDVEFDGTVKLPLLGRISIKGMTVREAELFLEEKYSTYYNKPFVLLEVTNRRVIIFPGSEGTAKVVSLQNENTTLFEALAQAGGISQTGKAYKVKLIRGDLKNPQVHLIDLSTIDGIKQADLILQANDIIYIEPRLRVTRDIMAETLPYLSFITTIVLFMQFVYSRTGK